VLTYCERKNIDEIADKGSKKYRISITELKSGSRCRESIEARRVMAWDCPPIGREKGFR